MQGKEVTRCLLHLWQACTQYDASESLQRLCGPPPASDMRVTIAPTAAARAAKYRSGNSPCRCCSPRLEIPRPRITWKPTLACLLGWSYNGTWPCSKSHTSALQQLSHTPRICRMWIHTGRTAGGSTCESWLELAHDFICGVKKAIGYVCILGTARNQHASPTASASFRNVPECREYAASLLGIGKVYMALISLL
jgi:hypothetical protein